MPPNLYWALAQLPRPLIDMEPALTSEMSIGPRVFAFLKDPETAQHSPQEWGRLLSRGLADLAQFDNRAGLVWLAGRAGDWQAQLVALAVVMKTYPEAKRTLMIAGMRPEQIEAMPAAQVVAIAAARSYQYVADTYAKWSHVPFWQAHLRWKDMEKKLRSEGYFTKMVGGKDILPVASLLLPATHAARMAEMRLERNLAVLRTIEAIRIHAAITGGKLPATLADVGSHDGPLVVAPVARGGAPRAVAGLLYSGQADGPAAQPAGKRRGSEPFDICRLKGDVVLAGSTATVKRAESLTPTPRPDLAAALAEVASATIGGATSLGADSRRVVREMFPPLPDPCADVTGNLIADGVRWGALGIDLAPDFRVRLILQARDTTSTGTIRQSGQRTASKGPGQLFGTGRPAPGVFRCDRPANQGVHGRYVTDDSARRSGAQVRRRLDEAGRPEG